MIARAKQRSFSTVDLPTWVGATLVRHFSRPPAAKKRLDWSVQYRRRCADALVFLENVRLVDLINSADRSVTLTSEGVTVVRQLSARSDEIGLLCRGLSRAYRAADRYGLELL